MGVHRRQKTPTLYRPSSVFFYGGLLLCLAFGINVAAIHDSFLAGDWAWFAFFAAAEATLAVLYFWNVRSWLRWSHRTGDYNPVAMDVVSCHDEYSSEYDHHPGEHGQP